MLCDRCLAPENVFETIQDDPFPVLNHSIVFSISIEIFYELRTEIEIQKMASRML